MTECTQAQALTNGGQCAVRCSAGWTGSTQTWTCDQDNYRQNIPPTGNLPSCTGCASGRYKAAIGENRCDICPAHATTADHATTLDSISQCLCEQGYAGAIVNANSACVACTAGFAKDAPPSTDACVACTTGKYAGVAARQCAACVAGRADTDNDAATPCSFSGEYIATQSHNWPLIWV